MVRDGNAWTPASSSNPLHTRDAALASLIGALNAAKETNPDAASASMLALLRGMLATFGKETTLAAVKAAAESLAQEDFATETTLAALLSAVGNLATEATLSGVKSAVDTLAGTVADGAQKVTLSGSSVPDGQPIPAKLLGTRADTLARRFTGMYRIARVGPLAANTTETVADITDGASYDIEYIELATNHDSDIRFTIQGYQENGGLAGAMRPITATGSSEIGLSAANVRQHGSAQWELAVDDPQQNRYKLVCKRQVPVGRGFRVQVMNVNMTTSYNAGVIIQYNKTAS